MEFHKCQILYVSVFCALHVLDGARRDVLKVMEPEDLPHLPRGVCATTVKEYVEISRFFTVTMVAMGSTEQRAGVTD